MRRNGRIKLHIINKKIIFLICALIAVIGIVLYHANRVKASVWDSPKSFTDQYGEDVVFNPDDGYLYCGSSARLAGSGVRTKFETVGWQVLVQDSNNNTVQALYFSLGGRMSRYRSEIIGNIEYEIYRISLNDVKGMMNSYARSTLDQASSHLVFNAGNVVKYNDVLQGQMWDSVDSPVTSGTVYFSYDGINGAAPWSDTTHSMLNNYYNKQIRNLYYTVQIESRGSGVTSYSGQGTYCYGAKVTMNASSATGYQISKWYHKYGGGTISNSDRFMLKVTGNMYIVVEGKGNPYTITYDANGGSNAPAAQTYEYGYGSINLSSQIPVWYGHDFQGWSRSKYAADPSWGAGSAYGKIIGDSNLYAVWRLHPYVQTNNFYKQKNGNWVKFDETSHTVEYSKYYTCTNEGVSTPTGYHWWKFATPGWTVTADKNDKDGNGYYLPNKYKIKYDANKGQGAMEDSEHTYDVSKKLSVNNGQISRVGYNFVGWSTKPNGYVMYSDGDMVTNLSEKDGDVIRLYAVWEPIHYNVSYNGNGALTGSVATQKNVEYDKSYKYQTNTYRKQTTYERYDFIGWSQDPQGKEALVQGGDTYANLTATDHETIKMYAIWQKDNRDYTVTINPNGGTIIYNDKEYTQPFKIVGKYGTTFDLVMKSDLNSSDQYFNKWKQNNVRVLALQNIATIPCTFQIMGNGTIDATWSTKCTITVDPNGGTVNGNTSKFTIDTKKGDVIVLDYSFCDYSLKDVTYNTTGCIKADGAYIKSKDYSESYSYDRTTGTYTDSTTGMKPKAGYNISYAAYVVNKSGTVTVNWNIPASSNIYKITLDDNGGSGGVGAIYEKCGIGFYADEDAAVKINTVDSVPKRSGYTFKGYWSTKESNGGTQYIDANGKIVNATNSTFTADTTLYARWDEIPVPDIHYTVEHYLSVVDPRTGNESYSDIPTVTDEYAGYSGKEVALKDLVRSDGDMIGFVYQKGTLDGVEKSSVTSTNGMVIKLYYARDYFKVDLAYDEGIASVSQKGVAEKQNSGTKYYKYGTNVTITATAAKDSSFSNWQCVTGGVKASSSSNYTFVMPAQNASFMANSSISGKYMISYDLNGGKLDDANPTNYTKNTETIKLNNPKKENATFTGWTGSNGDTPQTDVEIKKGSTGNKSYKANWDWNVYTITLNNQGAEETGTEKYYEKYSVANYEKYDKDNKTCSDEITKITVPKKEGCNFLGYYNKEQWSGGADAVQYIDDTGKLLVDDTKFESDTTIYAWYEKKISKVTLDNKNADIAGTEFYYIKYLDAYYMEETCSVPVATIEIPYKEGYSFLGYYTKEDGAGEQWVNESGDIKKDLTRTSDITLYAKWGPKEYTLTFEYNKPENASETMINNGTINKKIYYGLAYGDLPEPTIKGWKFMGWYTSKEDNADEVTKETVCDGNAIIYAKWEPVKYTVRFDKNKPSNATSEVEGNMEDVETTYDRVAWLPPVDYTLTGWEFVNWNTKPDGSGITYEEDDPLWNMTAEDNGVVVLYAQWSANDYIIHFDANTAEGTMSDIKMTYDVPQKLPENAFKKTGYTFEGWSLTPDGKVKYTDEEEIMNVTAERNVTVTLYAIWAANPYIIHFDGNNATSGTMDDQNMVYDQPEKLYTNKFKREGYTFKGWSLDPNAPDAEYADAEEIVNITTERNATVTLYAIWSANHFVIHFDGNGATGGKMSDIDVTYDKDLTLPANQFTRTGATYLRWSNKPESDDHVPDIDLDGYIYYENMQYFSVDQVKNLLSLYDSDTKFADENDGEITLYAVWDLQAVIKAEDQYITMKEAENITEDKLYEKITVTDREQSIIPHLKPGEDPDGVLNYIKDFDAEEVKNLPSECGISLTVHVRDKVGNESERAFNLYVVDTTGQNESSKAKVRSIEEKYSDAGVTGGLSEKSVWSQETDYKNLLKDAVTNKRTGEEKNTIHAYGSDFEVTEEGTGSIDYKEKWTFSADDVKKIREEAIKNSSDTSVKEKKAIQNFISKFGSHKIEQTDR